MKYIETCEKFKNWHEPTYKEKLAMNGLVKIEDMQEL